MIANTCKSFALILSRDTLVDRVFYQSTRGGVRGVSFEDAVLSGYAPDGGLLVPELVPLFTAQQLLDLADVAAGALQYDVEVGVATHAADVSRSARQSRRKAS